MSKSFTITETKMSYSGCSSGCGYCSGHSSSSQTLSLSNMVAASYASKYDTGIVYSIESSELESKVEKAEEVKTPMYLTAKKEEYNSNYIKDKLTSKYSFNPEPFLKAERPFSQFINDAEEIREFVEETFKLTTGKEFPKDIVVHVGSEDELRAIHSRNGGSWSDGIVGFAINQKPFISEIFVRKESLDRLMITIGHEIGHCMSMPLRNIKDEEAKAFAFSIAWMEAIKNNNIADLAGSIELGRPALNGLHNAALKFVKKMIDCGRSALDVFNELVKCKVSVENVTWGD